MSAVSRYAVFLVFGLLAIALCVLALYAGQGG